MARRKDGSGRDKQPRDGWDGRWFRDTRRELGRTREWVATKTGVSAQMIALYELDKVFPSHRWRDAAALALSVRRKNLGLEGE